MLIMSIVVKGGTAFLGGRFGKRDILIDGGLIRAVGTGLSGDERLDATGMLVLPGLIDPHVHLREPGDTYKEDFSTGSRAAVAGGFTTVIDMPNNSIPTISRERLEEKRRLAAGKAICDVLFHFGGTDDNFEEVRKSDARSLKLYLGQTTGMLVLRKPDSLKRHFLGFPKDRPIVLHVSDHSEDEEENLSRTFATLENAVSLAAGQGRRIHLAHASTGKEIQIAKRYSGCTVEVAPHHLFLSTADRERLGPMAKVYPPLRSEQKRIGLWSALERADCIATDHAPHTVEDKEKGAAGFPGLETSLALMFEGCARGLLDKIWVAQRMSCNVADAFGISGKGRLLEGYAGDVTVVDPKKEWKVDSSELQTKCKWSPFDGMTLHGKVRSVVKGGRVLLDEFRFV
jgi:dihydroorotase (multifunctional complex type)